MRDITEPILDWVKCSSEIWKNWFKTREHGAYTFSELEEKLFELLVCREIEIPFTETGIESFFANMRVQYLHDIYETRQIVVRQRAGNLFGSPKVVKIDKGSIYSIHRIDTAGTMLNSQPYVEVVWGNGMLLEAIDNVTFFYKN